MTDTHEPISEEEMEQWEWEIAQPETWGGYNPVVSRLIAEVRRLRGEVARWQEIYTKDHPPQPYQSMCSGKSDGRPE